MTIDASILDYWGKINDYVVVVISLMYNGKYYEGLCLYNKYDFKFVVEDELENDIGCKFYDYCEYNGVVEYLRKRLIPYDEIINIVNDINLN